MMESTPEHPKAVAEQAQPTSTVTQTPARARLHDRVENDFHRHRLGELGTARAVSIRQAIRDVAHTMVDRVPEGRELSTALTKLEEAMFWATAGIARLEPRE
jgi:hypothetical protein